MKKILLVCSAGMSTSLLVSKMKDYAQSINYDVDIEAQPIGTVADTGKLADVILLGPQIRFNLAKVKGLFPDKPVEAIDITAYGTLDAAKIVGHVKELLGD